MECLKNCCKRLIKKRGAEPDETDGIAMQINPGGSKSSSIDGSHTDYFLSKLPQDGKEVPFILPTTKTSYVQPAASDSHDLLYQMPGVGERPDGSKLHNSNKKNYDSLSSTVSTSSSFQSSTESSCESGEDLGSLCVRLSYQEKEEQVWITLVQCSQLNLPVNAAQKPRIQIRGIITLPKAIHFKTTIKEYSQDTHFMETFVFALSLQTLHRSALLLKLQTHGARKRTAAECVLSLRGLQTRETEQWLRLGPPGAAARKGCELRLATCFQPVYRRIQVRALAAQNLQTSSLSLAQEYAVTVELHGDGIPVAREKTLALKAVEGQCQWNAVFYLELGALHPSSCRLSIQLFVRTSLKKKRCVGQVQLGLAVPNPEAVEQWKDTIEHPEKVVTAWHAVT
ncbi:tandem C2 domains nuclear protein [Stigmatopora argus]